MTFLPETQYLRCGHWCPLVGTWSSMILNRLYWYPNMVSVPLELVNIKLLKSVLEILCTVYAPDFFGDAVPGQDWFGDGRSFEQASTMLSTIEFEVSFEAGRVFVLGKKVSDGGWGMIRAMELESFMNENRLVDLPSLLQRNPFQLLQGFGSTRAFCISK